ncbi:MAG TPA: penicillin-binding protein 2 [Casimicrobium huifangae]|jgi:cell division protein FtsI (penicillin-binding protein 3)|uniref:peptidoglycan D,D-transpeptidase FtsI family protein n=1 Tax=Casimicrobium huifangae TaxID=2591109 RepID=UPI002CB0069C|nr:penicillin-binding protein 2 [Casimicrobium huifangae]HQA34177.1 penicillin-binding protein 2 [Casimicrobium huifangae]HQD65284.1 penicillin-binding protein 2 [Casimicrobium huifangae]
MARTANTKSTPQFAVWRVRAVAYGLLAGFAVLAGRGIYLQVVQHEDLTRRGDARTTRDLVLPAHRGRLLDREGAVLASSVPARGVFAFPDQVEISDAQRAALAKALALKPKDLERKLDSERDLVFLARGVSPEQGQAVAALKIPGVAIQTEYKREYPSQEVVGQVLGITNVDDVGQEGIELAQNEWLSGKPGVRRVTIDRRGGVVEELGSVRAPQQGRDLQLALDSRVQHLAFRELKRGVDAHRAKGGAAVVLDARSGEILALVNYPTAKPGDRAAAATGGLRNRAVADLFEPGSTMKPFTVSTAIETGAVRPDTLIPMQGSTYTLNGATIRDTHAIGSNGVVSLTEIVQKSSNVGTAKIAEKLPNEVMWRHLQRAGFGRAPQTGVPGEAHGRLRAPQSWRPIEKATMSYGYGLSVNLVQLARAYTVFANQGSLVDVTLFKNGGAARQVPVYSPETMRWVLPMLEKATSKEGTAPLSQVPGYRVAGKTGTAKKLAGAIYSEGRYVASFVGLAPVSNPRYVVAVMIDEPAGGIFYGGQVAAPVFSSIMGQTLRLMEVPYDAPLPGVPTAVDTQVAIVREGQP